MEDSSSGGLKLEISNAIEEGFKFETDDVEEDINFRKADHDDSESKSKDTEGITKTDLEMTEKLENTVVTMEIYPDLSAMVSKNTHRDCHGYHSNMT